MSPGRELDRLIDDKVLGRRIRAYPCCELRGFFIYRPYRNAAEPPPFSTDFSAAWLLLRLIQSEWWVSVHPYNDAATVRMRRIFPDPGEESGEIWIHGDTMPMAVSLAALRSVGYFAHLFV